MAVPPEPGSNLPAPYEDPWRLLARDLRAVAASLVLRARELWRRNGEGDLSLPAFWPASLGALFWPLVLVALLLLPPIGWRLLHPVPAPAASQAPPPPAASQAPPPPAAPSAPAAPGPRPPAKAEPAAPPAEADAEASPSGVAMPPPPADPLLPFLPADDPRHLITAVRPDGGRGRMDLTLGRGFFLLPAEQRRRWAERWRERALELGYEWLELQDGEGRLVGRQALVGSGMILLDPDPQP